MTDPLDLEDVDPDVLIDVTAFVARRAATDLVLLHHLTAALGTPPSWFSQVGVLLHDFAHELAPIAPKEKP